jgi:ATP:ADP antiporter, AAA family
VPGVSLAPFTDVRPDERRGALGAFLILFGILAGHTVLETARDALFLSRLPASRLPWVYLAMAGAAVVVWKFQGRALRRLPGARGLAALLAFVAFVTFWFWALGSWTHPWALGALYVWSGLVGTLTAVQFWLVLSDKYTITQAKRLYKVIGAGSVLGAVAGAGIARVVGERFSGGALVLASAILFGLTATGAFSLAAAKGARAAPPVDPADVAPMSIRDWSALLRAHPYVPRLGGLVLVSTVALTLGDYVFKSQVAQHIDKAQLPEFFATVYMVLNLLALVAQFLLTGWLLRVAGLHRALWVLPALVAMGATGVAVGGGLVAALLLKGADGTLRYSLHRTTTELLFLPIPDGLRGRVKPLIDMLAQRGGQALASIFILSEVVLRRGDIVLSLAAAILCVVWIAWAIDLRPHYLELFRSALREGTMRRDPDAPELDLEALEALFTALNSREDVEVVAAIDLLAEEGRVRLIPALILYHPSAEVVLRALDVLGPSGRTDFVPVADRLLSHQNAEIRAAALRARAAAAPDERLLRSAMEDPSPLVQATALVGLVSAGWVEDEADRASEALMNTRFPEAPRALARAIRLQPAARFKNVLLELAQSADREVQAQSAHAMQAMGDPDFLPALLPLLHPHEVREAARSALVSFGTPALEHLDRAMADDRLPHEIRRHLPRTISRFPAEQAAPLLLRRLVEEPDGMVRFKILRGLGRLATGRPDLPLDAGILRQATARTLEAAFRLVDWRLTLLRGAAAQPERATPGHELLVALLRDKEVHARERVFRLLDLQFRGQDLERIYRGLASQDPKVQASSRELLEALLLPPQREAVLALVNDVPDRVRLTQAEAFYRARDTGYEELLASLLDEPGETLRCIAAYHVAELGLQTFRPRLEAARTKETGLFVSRVLERALRMLTEAAAVPRTAHAT